MAKNRFPEADTLVEEEEEEGSSDSQQESYSESEEEDNTLARPPAILKKPSAPKKPDTTPPPSSSARPRSPSSEDSGSESDSPPDNIRRADPTVKPIASRSMEEPPMATKKPRSKLPSSTPKSGTTTSVKRPLESEINSNSYLDSKKRARRKKADEATSKKTNGDDESRKKQLFQRLWSEDDEIAILRGMIEYAAEKGADPVADMNDFFAFVKKSLHVVDFTKTQLADKVRRLKKKYKNNASKGKQKGKDRTFSKVHEQIAYGLSKKIWGVGEAISNGTGVDNSTKDYEKARENQNQIEEGTNREIEPKGANMEVEPNAQKSIRIYGSIGESSLNEEIIIDGLELISSAKKLELEEKWKKLRVEEMELYLKRVGLIREQTKLVLAALKSSSGH